MSVAIAPRGRVNSRRLAGLLGEWRGGGSRSGGADLAAAIRLLVLDGRLAAGTGLPPERELAAELGVSRTMVASAWETLRADGLLVSRRGAGSWTTLPDTGGAGSLGTAPADAGDPRLIDLARAMPAAAPGVAAAAEAALCHLPAALTSHGQDERGVPRLRQRIADRYTERGLPTTADQVLVTSGAQHALAMAVRLFTGPGDRVLVEQPTYPNAIEAIRAAHAIPIPVPMVEFDQVDWAAAGAGWDLDGIEATLRQAAPRLAYLVLDFQNPTGFRLDQAGRERLAAALRRTRTPAVVDETHVELDLSAAPGDAGPAPLGVFAGDLVVAAGSAGKALWDGLRLGWVRAPAEIISRLVLARRGLDLGSAVFEQFVLAELLGRGAAWDGPRRAEFADRRDALADAVRTHCPDWSFRVPDGGLCLWCRLPAAMSTRLAVAAQSVGVRVVPGSVFAVHGGLERWLRLPYVLDQDTLREAVRRLALAAHAVSSVAGSGGQFPDNGNVPVT